MTKPLDVITIGRSSVDLYGVQIGGRLEDMGSFRKYIGGSPTNIACRNGAPRSEVGADHPRGRRAYGAIHPRAARDARAWTSRGVKTDPERLTALVLLGIRDEEQFPLIFYRENCADMALCEDDIDEDFIRSARSVVVTGTHLSHPRTEAAVLKALRIAREHGVTTALDIDYRPNLWGVAGHGEGESRFVESAKVTRSCSRPDICSTSSSARKRSSTSPAARPTRSTALRAVRAVSEATLVCKRGAVGAVAFTGAIPEQPR